MKIENPQKGLYKNARFGLKEIIPIQHLIIREMTEFRVMNSDEVLYRDGAQQQNIHVICG